MHLSYAACLNNGHIMTVTYIQNQNKNSTANKPNTNCCATRKSCCVPVIYYKLQHCLSRVLMHVKLRAMYMHERTRAHVHVLIVRSLFLLPTSPCSAAGTATSPATSPATATAPAAAISVFLSTKQTQSMIFSKQNK